MSDQQPTDLKARTKAFALRIIRLVGSLPRNPTADVLGKQLLRCGTSVGANYRAAKRGRSPAEFAAKLGIVEEEADFKPGTRNAEPGTRGFFPFQVPGSGFRVPGS